MANFVGVVTQQDVQTGVTLRARVTSPKEHYTAYQDFKCMIKKGGLTDEQAVMTDLNTVSNKLLANGATGITQNLTAYMPATGDNETTITYNVVGDDISEYFNNDGIVVKRPLYGSSVVVGSLTITVTKNAAIAERNITVSVEPYTAEELVQSVLDTITWDNIRGKNGIETVDPNTNGMYNIAYPLKLASTVTSELSSTPVTVTWSITQDALSTHLGGDSRIDVNTGAVTRPSYSDIYEAKDVEISSRVLEIITSKVENIYGDTYYRINGLTLQATVDIGVATTIDNTVVFNLKTLSAPLTNNEVASYLMNHTSFLSIKDTKSGSVFTLSTASDTTERMAYYDTTGANSSIISLFKADDDSKLILTKDNDFTESSFEIKVRWALIDPSTIDTTLPVETLNFAEWSSLGFQLSGDNYLFVLDPATAPTETKLIFRCQLSISGYSGGGGANVMLYYRFILNDATPTTTGGTTTGGTTTGGTTTGP